MNLSYQKKLNNIIEKLEKIISNMDTDLKNETCPIKKEIFLHGIIIYSQKMKKAYTFLEDISRTISVETLDNIEDIKIFISIESIENKKAL